MALLKQILEVLKRPFHKKSEDFLDDGEYGEEEYYEPEEPEPDPMPEPQPDLPEPSSQTKTDGFMQAIEEMPKGKRVMIMAGFSVILAGGLFLGIRYNRQKAVKPAPQTAAVDTAKQPKHESGVATTLGGPVMVNPFIEVTGDNTKQLPASSLPQLPGGGNTQAQRSSYSGNGSLPSIPSYNPRPSLPQIPMPASSPSGSTSSTTVVSSAAPATIQGIVTGEDGNNMAIMSDGSVVSKGESFKDGRVAYIGGDGIQFENGTTMNFNQ